MGQVPIGRPGGMTVWPGRSRDRTHLTDIDDIHTFKPLSRAVRTPASKRILSLERQQMTQLRQTQKMSTSSDARWSAAAPRLSPAPHYHSYPHHLLSLTKSVARYSWMNRRLLQFPLLHRPTQTRAPFPEVLLRLLRACRHPSL